MVEALGHRRPIVNGYSGQRPPFFGGAVAALSTFPSVEAAWMLHDLDVRFVVTPTRDRHRGVAARRAGAPARGVTVSSATSTSWRGRPRSRRGSGEPAAPVPPPPGPLPFAPGERLVYGVTWDGPAGALEAGDVTFEVEPAPAAGRHRFAVGARTAPWVARFFEADDRFATTTDDAVRPLLHERRIREGRRALDQRARVRPGGPLGPAADARTASRPGRRCASGPRPATRSRRSITCVR